MNLNNNFKKHNINYLFNILTILSIYQKLSIEYDNHNNNR